MDSSKAEMGSFLPGDDPDKTEFRNQERRMKEGLLEEKNFNDPLLIRGGKRYDAGEGQNRA